VVDDDLLRYPGGPHLLPHEAMKTLQARPRVLLRCAAPLLLVGVGCAPTPGPAASAGALAPPDVPAEWSGLIGAYRWGADTVSVLEREGRLHLWSDGGAHRLEQLSPDEFRFLEGPHGDRRLVFERGPGGRAELAVAGSDTLRPVAVGPEGGTSFRITPRRPVAELRREALAAEPPREHGERLQPDLVELTALEPGIRLDIRYATTNNFMGERFYDEPRAFLQRPAAEALVRAHRKLAGSGYGLLVHDAYRPWYVTRMFWDATPDEQRIFVADPSRGSRHNRGAAVDLTLYDLRTGEPVEMPGGYDEFSPRSYPDYPGGTSLQRWHRALLRRAMEAEGFTVYETEWWHFDYDDWARYPIQNLTFDRIPAAR
jgi:D-alanyl-D-alanine dipeptidase